MPTFKHTGSPPPPSSPSAAAGDVDASAPPEVDDHYRNTIEQLKRDIDAAPPRPKDADGAAGGKPTSSYPATNQNNPRSGFRGVSQKSLNCYGASVYVSRLNRNVFLGVFPSAELAARMYDAAATIVFGPDAYVNFPGSATHEPPTGAQVAAMKLKVTGGRTASCKECGQELPVKTRVCGRCRAPVKFKDVPFKGVRVKLRGNNQPRYQAVFCLKGKVEFIGTFRTQEEAARAYDARAREAYGSEEGRTNFATTAEADAACEEGLRKLSAAGGDLAPIVTKRKSERKSDGDDSDDELELRRRKKRRREEKASGGGNGGGGNGGGGKGKGGGSGRGRRSNYYDRLLVSGGGGFVDADERAWGGGAGNDLSSTGGLDFSVAPPKQRKGGKSIAEQLLGSL